ncbi:uncharacterized protein BDW43DRAFT_281540 [Aspergillus alliaceus]|uniref:uncharacterized protein n=1 Tax=Petromyces alliaceus TaxID=209559 RepID=UPI0012A4B158|nr:uncharacterized protein BDW43DRAFT_281540 [Aspergillus alliaceus]KAB8231746.1 hypothetical protein BDW43DRAFT_281540 [Aspergillus alliaceus]
MLTFISRHPDFFSKIQMEIENYPELLADPVSISILRYPILRLSFYFSLLSVSTPE